MQPVQRYGLNGHGINPLLEDPIEGIHRMQISLPNEPNFVFRVIEASKSILRCTGYVKYEIYRIDGKRVGECEKTATVATDRESMLKLIGDTYKDCITTA